MYHCDGESKAYLSPTLSHATHTRAISIGKPFCDLLFFNPVQFGYPSGKYTKRQTKKIWDTHLPSSKSLSTTHTDTIHLISGRVSEKIGNHFTSGFFGSFFTPRTTCHLTLWTWANLGNSRTTLFTRPGAECHSLLLLHTLWSHSETSEHCVSCCRHLATEHSLGGTGWHAPESCSRKGTSASGTSNLSSSCVFQQESCEREVQCFGFVR